jgi:hypothetical protein
LAKKIALLELNIRQFCRKSDHNIGFLRKTPIFSAENLPKSQKIMIITSVPGQRIRDLSGFRLFSASVVGEQLQVEPHGDLWGRFYETVAAVI